VTVTTAGTERHLPILILLVRVWGALSVLIGISMLLLGVGAAAILADPGWPREAFGTGITVGAFAVVFGVIGAFAVVWGSAHLWAGVLLRNHRPIGRVLTLGLSLVNLLVLPFGTVMGAYALWLLMTHDARQLFGAATATR
jgi:nitrate reductase gamma subunit